MTGVSFHVQPQAHYLMSGGFARPGAPIPGHPGRVYGPVPIATTNITVNS
jgi:hypothetical protein